MKKIISLLLLAFLSLFWIVVISRTYTQKDITVVFHGELPYGCSLDQLKNDINTHLKGADNPNFILKDFFEKIEQYHSVEVRCATPSVCHIEAKRSGVLAHTPQGQLLLETPIRLSANPYSYQSNILLDTFVAPNQEIAELCKNIHAGLFFKNTEIVRLQIFADKTVFMKFEPATFELWFWPIKGAEQKWIDLQKNIDKPLTSFVSCDMRYISGAVCELKKSDKSSKR